MGLNTDNQIRENQRRANAVTVIISQMSPEMRSIYSPLLEKNRVEAYTQALNLAYKNSHDDIVRNLKNYPTA